MIIINITLKEIIFLDDRFGGRCYNVVIDANYLKSLC